MFHFSLVAFLFTHLWLLGLMLAAGIGVGVYFGKAAFVSFILNPRTLLVAAAIAAVVGYTSLKGENDALRRQTSALQAQVQTVKDGQRAVATKVIIQQQNAKDKDKLTKVIQSSPAGKATDNVLDEIDNQDHPGKASQGHAGADAGDAGAGAGRVRDDGSTTRP